MSHDEINIRLLISRIRDIETIFGTLTDTSNLVYIPEACPDIFPNDLILFKLVVQRGIMKDAMWRPPYGYKILSFLTTLSEYQQATRDRIDKDQRAELNQIYLSHR